MNQELNRAEYLSQLDKYLKKLPEPDYENAMEYFTEYFEEAGEKRAIEELGTPKEAAEDILNNLLSRNPEKENKPENDTVNETENGLDNPRKALSLTFLLFLCVAAASFLAGLSLLWLGGRYLVYGIMAFSHSLPGACVMAGMGVFGIGGGFLIFAGITMLGHRILSGRMQMGGRLIIRGRNKK